MQLEKKKKVVRIVMIALAIFVIGATVYCCIILKNSSRKTITWLAAGDSITWGEGDYIKSYIDYIDRKHPEIRIDKRGIPGMYTAELVLYSDSGFFDVDYNPDIVTVLMGTNDFGCNIPLNQYEKDLENLIKIMKERFPKSRIIFLTPLYRDYYGDKVYIMPGMVNYNGNSLYDYINLIKVKSKENGIELIELTEDEYFNKDNLREYTVDGLHPNSKGNRLIADKLYNAIITNYRIINMRGKSYEGNNSGRWLRGQTLAFIKEELSEAVHTI